MTVAGGLRTVSVHKDSPLCGDVIDLVAKTWDDRVVSATYRAHACSLARASAAILARTVPGRSVDEALALSSRLGGALRGEGALPDGFDDVAPALLMPARRKCVLLPWAALAEALS